MMCNTDTVVAPTPTVLFPFVMLQNEAHLNSLINGKHWEYLTEKKTGSHLIHHNKPVLSALISSLMLQSKFSFPSRFCFGKCFCAEPHLLIQFS